MDQFHGRQRGPHRQRRLDDGNNVLSVSGSGAGHQLARPQNSIDFGLANPRCGNGTIIAHLTTAQAENDEAGLMIRESLSSSGKSVSLAITSKNVQLIHRAPKTAATSVTAKKTTKVVPQWVKIVRRGNTFTAFDSVDGKHWVKVGAAVVKMNAKVDVGLTVSSRRCCYA